MSRYRWPILLFAAALAIFCGLLSLPLMAKDSYGFLELETPYARAVYETRRRPRTVLTERRYFVERNWHDVVGQASNELPDSSWDRWLFNRRNPDRPMMLYRRGKKSVAIISAKKADDGRVSMRLARADDPECGTVVIVAEPARPEDMWRSIVRTQRWLSKNVRFLF